MLNINSTSDEHYRYKMPEIEAKIESRGNGIKTLIPNLSKVSKAISRPTKYTTKYLAFELGSMAKIDEQLDRYLIMGAHPPEKLQAVIYKFIENYVLCHSCKNPETRIVVEGKKMASLSCAACGATSPLDPKQQIVQFIIKNPPSEDFAPVTYAANAECNDEQDEIEDFSTKISAEEVKKDELKLAQSIKEIAQTTETVDSKLEKFENALKPHISTLKSGEKDENFNQIIKTLIKYSSELEIRSLVSSVLAKKIFTPSTESSDLTKCLTPNSLLIIASFLNNHTMSQLNFLVGLEETLCTKKLTEAKLGFNLKLLPNLFMFFYDRDLIDEAILQKWFENFKTSAAKTKSYDQKKIASLEASLTEFFEWLNKSEDESGSDEEEDKVDGSDKQKTPSAQNQPLSTANLASKLNQQTISDSKNNDDDEDFDIDDI